MIIQQYKPEYESAVIELWRKCNLVRPQNDPKKDIKRKLKVNPELFLVGVEGGKVIAAAMGGYEGHRGWVNYLGVDPEYRHRGLGRKMMEALEEKLLEMGCPKLNLQVYADNTGAVKFYERIGYKNDGVVSLGKRLIPD
ncbi:MAG: GNAT family acetyltransferase [Chloroflexi bacterium RBG_13_51_52]|nr:MAG: GNAT family acetyltransferase [Chloroflexi bacterium RBG_13_51_52]